MKMEEIKKKLEAVRKKLREDIEKMERELNVEIPKALHTAAEHGDLSENAEYDAAKQRQSFLRGRLRQLYDKFEMINRIDLESLPRDRVTLFSTVTVIDCDTEMKRTFHISLADILEMEACPNGISFHSPIAQALLDQSCGDIVDVQRGDRMHEWEIVEIKNIWGEVITECE
ncbi:MAG: transcription elongation factor GreA [Deltaproteobacteria bacterium]|nr:MAG: transcription elongation factor GreA [Deltaproteobacteria bacterium]